MPIYTDQLKRLVEIPALPKRIISLVPSQTELLFDLGLDEEVIGITKFCVHPPHWFNNKTKIGGTKNVNINVVTSLQPDLIIANKEENTKEQIEVLEKIAPVWISDIENMKDALNMIQGIGNITGKNAKAAVLVDTIKKDFDKLSSTISLSGTPKIRTAYLIWKDPYMTVGANTFIHDLLQVSGFENVFSDLSRYPVITIDELKHRNTELVMLSSEPYPFQQKHIDELQTLLPNAQVMLTDGEMFSWYGSRMQLAPAYINHLLAQLKARISGE